MITDRVSAFIQSSAAGVHGINVGAAAREAMNLLGRYSIGIRQEFDLAVYDHLKKQEAGSTPTTEDAARADPSRSRRTSSLNDATAM